MQWRYRAVQCSGVKFIVALYNAVAVQYSALQLWSVQCSAVQCTFQAALQCIHCSSAHVLLICNVSVPLLHYKYIS